MNELQLTLIGIGVAVIAAIWIFNRIQEWRWHRMAKSTLGTGRPDVLLGEAPGVNTESDDSMAHDLDGHSALNALNDIHDHEHELDHDQMLAKRLDAMAHEEAETEAQLASMRLGMVAADTPHDEVSLDSAATDTAIPGRDENAEPSSDRPPRDELTAPPDESIEYLVTLGCTTPVTGTELWQNLSRSSTPVRGARWLGRRVTDGGWSVVQPDSEQRFDSLRAALLLASRTGPVGELELERFCSLVSALGTSMNLRVEFPPRAPALERAIQLDQFCAEVDIVVGMNVVATGGQTISGGRIARWADTHGMTLGKDGSYHYLNPQGYTIWRLSNRDPRPFSPGGVAQMTVSGVTFLLDVPMVEAANERLSPMFDAAATLARELNARVLDDNGQQLGPQQLGRIERELANLLLKMQADGIPAGEVRARRLFSS
jgi:ZipA, C-terminal FtsZ-binding domain